MPVVEYFLYKDEVPETDSENNNDENVPADSNANCRVSGVNENIKTPASGTSSCAFFGDLYENEELIVEQQNTNATIAYERKMKILSEINKLAQFLSNKEEVVATKQSNLFWKQNVGEYPHLSSLYQILQLINSSFIERFFSICGIIKNKRNHNMKDDLFIIRSMLTINMDILNQINAKYFKNTNRVRKT